MTRWNAACVLAMLALAGCRRGAVGDDIVASGYVEATDVRIASKVAGRVLKAPLQEGDRVALGQLVAEVDTTDIDLALATARAERDQAQAELRLRLAGARSEDIAELQAQVESVKADVEGARLEAERMGRLLADGFATEKARDDARARYEGLVARQRAVEQALARARAGSRREEIDQARARAAAAEARIAVIEQQRRDATVTSPLDGLVTERIAEPGELMQPGSSLSVLTDLKNAWLTVYVAEPDLGRIRVGQQAQVVTDGGERRTGHVMQVASQAEFTPRNVQTRDERVKLVYRVKIALPNDDGLFKPGMPAEARLQRAAP